MPDLAMMLVSLGTIPLFASRTFGTTFWIALMARIQAGGILFSAEGLGPFNLNLAAHCPDWLISNQGLFFLALLALMESGADKSPDLRLMTSPFGPP